MQSGREQLRHWMDRREVNLEGAANLLGFDQTFVSKLLNGHRKPGLDNAIRIENVTGISVRSWVLDPSSEVDGSVSSRVATSRKAW